LPLGNNFRKEKGIGLLLLFVLVDCPLQVEIGIPQAVGTATAVSVTGSPGQTVTGCMLASTVGEIPETVIITSSVREQPFGAVTFAV
jgi:hypothetical protein